MAGAEYWLAEAGGRSRAEIEEQRKQAKEAAEKAISLDPGLAEGYAARGLVRYGIDWDWRGAQADFERALSLDPGDMRIQVFESYVLASLGRLPDAVERARKAIELDPLSARGGSNLGFYLTSLGKLGEARQALERALEINPDDEWVNFNLGTNLLLAGEPQSAADRFRRAGEARGLAGAAMAERDLGHESESRRALETLIARHSEEAALRIAESFAWRGERDQAFSWLETAFQHRDQDLTNLKFDPLLAKLRGDPRYVAMLEKMKLPV
jgi:serine/threonine-protein kinase